VSTASDPANCGGCGVACAASEACVSGSCVASCDAGELECGGLCVDPQTDALHCGGCGVACDAGEVCQLGSCVTPAACGAGEIVCSGACVDPNDDPQHCGGCNEVCPAAQVCGGGECVLACSGAIDPGLPTVSLVGLAPNTELATARSIVGTARDVDLAAWYLEVAVAGTDDFTLLAQGTSSVSSGALATLDPTLLENGPMTLRLRAVDCGGQVVSTEVPFVVTGENKVGVYAIEFVDLEVPLAGLPIRITRRYDTRQRAIEGDFGMGWTLDVGVQGRVGRNVPIGRGWNFPAGGFLGLFPCTGGSNETESHFVEVRLSEQERYRFRPVLANVALLGSNLCEANVRFEQIDGRPGAELLVVGNDYVIEDGFSGNVVDGVSPSTAPYDPTTFQLVTREGWRYQISRDEGVEAVWSPDGESLTVSDAGIAHSAGVGIPFVRNAEGLITEIVDPAGNRIRYGYEGRELASVVDRAANPATRFFYLPGHYLDRIEDPTGATPVRVEYDSDGRMRRSFDESGNPELVDWDPVLNVGTFTSRGGTASRAVYDAQGRLVELQVGTYFPTRFQYDAEGRRTREDRVDPVTGVPQTTRRWEYDARGEVTRFVDEGGIETRTTYTYGSTGRLARREVRTGTGPTRVTLYDSAGRITQFGTGPNRVTMTYDAAGRVATEQRGVGGPIATLAYDARGNVVSITTGTQVQTATYDANNWLRSVTSDGTTIEYDYDANGRRTAVRADGVLQEEVLYDARGVMVGRTRPGEQLDFRFDDATGRQETILTEPRAGGDFLRTVTTMTRDLDDRVATLESRQFVVDEDGTILSDLGVSAPLETVERDDAARTERRVYVDGSSELRTFDRLGRLVSRVDEEGRTQTWTYDAAGRVTQMPDGSRIGYDADGRVDVRTDPAGRQTRLVYGSNGRVTQRERRDATGAVLGTDVYAYDATGRLTQATDAGGRIARFGLLGSRALGATGPFDTITPPSLGTPAGRVDEAGYGYAYSYSEATRTLTRSLVGQSAVERFVKDELGRVVEHQTFNGDVVRYGYDTAGNRALIDLPATATTAARTYTLSYTPGGDLAQVIDSARGATTYTYDARQRLTEIAYPPSDEYPSGSYVRFGRDRSGLVTSRQTPSGTTFYGYDAQRRLREVTDTRLGAGSYVYTRDAAGFVTRIDLPDGSLVERSPGPGGEVATIGLRNPDGDVVAWFGYVRDAAGRIVSATETVGGVTYTSTFVSDDRGRLIEENRNGVRTLYTYDDADNRVRVDRGGVVESYAYDAVGRLVAAGSRSFSYDANGSVTSELASDGTTRTFTYDALARLVAFEQGSLAATYDYDAEGIRFWASVEDGVDTTVDELLVDPTFAHAQVLEQSSGRSYVFGDDRIAVSEPGGASYLHADARDLRIGAAPGAASVDATDYDAFGQTLPSAPRAGGFGYTGEAHDDESGLVYLRARYYDPSLGRFLSRDSYVDQPPYAYVGNDPMNATDPSGHFTVTEKTGTMIGFDTLAAMQAPVAIPGTLQAVLVWHVAAQSPVVVGVGIVTTGATFYLLAAIALDQFTPAALHPNASVQEQLQRAIEQVRQRAASNQVQGLASISAVHVSEGVCEGAHATSDDVYTGTNRGAAKNRIRPLLRDGAPEIFPMVVGRLNLGAAALPDDPIVQACIAQYNFMTGAGASNFSQNPWSCSERDVISQVLDACGTSGLCHIDAMRTEAGDGVGNVCETLPDGSIKPNCCGCCLFWVEMKWNILNRPANDPWGALRDPACTILDVIDEQLAQNQCAILDDYFNGTAN
jgi:RHS repeat-associated protein